MKNAKTKNKKNTIIRNKIKNISKLMIIILSMFACWKNDTQHQVIITKKIKTKTKEEKKITEKENKLKKYLEYANKRKHLNFREKNKKILNKDIQKITEEELKKMKDEINRRDSIEKRYKKIYENENPQNLSSKEIKQQIELGKIKITEYANIINQYQLKNKKNLYNEFELYKMSIKQLNDIISKNHIEN